MKLNKLFVAAGIFAASMSFSSCVGDLDLLPTNDNDITPGVFAEDPEGYMRQTFADIFLNISTFGVNGNNALEGMDGGMSTFQRSVFNLEEVPTDEADWIPATDAIPHTLQFGIWTASDAVMLGAYSRDQIIVSLCNQFIQTDFQLETIADAAQRQNAMELREEFVRQAKIIRSCVYFYLISQFGNVPYSDENVEMGEIAPQLSTDFAEGRKLVTERVVETLEDIVSWYKTNDPNNKPPYGYVGLDVAEAMLVKYYLNYEVFTGTPAWQKCYEHAQAVISRRGNGGFDNTGLAMNYFQNFSPTNVDQNEIIWRIVSQNADTHTDAAGNNVGVLNWANGGFMMMAWIPDDDFGYSKYNTKKGWQCIVARRQLTEAFDWNADYTVSPDVRTSWWLTAADGYNIDNPDLDFDNYGNNGYIAVKYINWWINNDGSVDEAKSPTPIADVCMDYAAIRLAEIYLSAAEAALNGGGSTADALTYVNYIRKRAGLDPYTSINLTELRKERQRELYTENVRRTDLIRYGQWISGYTWNWKNNTPEGTDYPSRNMVYPIPTDVVITNGYVQNPGY